MTLLLTLLLAALVAWLIVRRPGFEEQEPIERWYEPRPVLSRRRAGRGMNGRRTD